MPWGVEDVHVLFGTEVWVHEGGSVEVAPPYGRQRLPPMTWVSWGRVRCLRRKTWRRPVAA